VNVWPTHVGTELIVVARLHFPRASAARLSAEHGPRISATAEVSPVSTLAWARHCWTDVRPRPRAPSAVD